MPEARLEGEKLMSSNPYYWEDGSLRWGSPKNVEHLILQLQTLDPQMKVSSVMHIGDRARSYGLSMSYERWDDKGWLDWKDESRPKNLAIWAIGPDDNKNYVGPQSAESLQQRIAALEAELLAAREAKCKAERERDEALAKAGGISGEIGSLGAHVAELKAENATLADNNQVLARSLAESLSLNLKLEAEAVRLREDRDIAVEDFRELSDLGDIRKVLQDRIVSLEQQNKSLREDRERLLTTLKDVTRCCYEAEMEGIGWLQEARALIAEIDALKAGERHG